MYIAVLKIVISFFIPIIFAILLNEIHNKAYSKFIQILVYLPYFLSWVIFAGIISDVFDVENGLVNNFLGLFGVEPVYWLGKGSTFIGVLVFTDIWKNFGWNSIVFVAALTATDKHLYEAAVIDGAKRWKQTIHITLPVLKPMIILAAVLSLGGILNAGFDQIFNLYNPLVYDRADIIDTYVYRLAFDGYDWTNSTIIGLLKGIVNAVLIVGGWRLAKRVAGYSVF